MKTQKEIKEKKEALKKELLEINQKKPLYTGLFIKKTKILTELSILNWVLDEFEAL